MPTYTATFRTDGEYATITVDARSAKQALRQAQDIWEQDSSALAFQRYDEIQPLNEIEITTPSGKPVAEWLDEDMHLRLAAEEMRSMLACAVDALKAAPKSKVRSVDADRNWIIKESERVLREAFGEE